MILKRFYDTRLSHASYLVGCPAAGKAVVIDPHRDVQIYLDAAAEDGMSIVYAAETHIHADFLSGSRELADRTGAQIIVSDTGPDEWKYSFAGNVRKVVHGDSFRVGALRFDVFDSAGHTPEHIAFILTDEAASVDPLMAFTGDFIFVGDVGRPDLLENVASIQGTAEPGARQIYASLQRFKKLPDDILICPAHGAGSPCGKSLSGVPFSTLGIEKRTNWALKADDEDAFVREVLSGQPEPPVYFAQMKRLNKIGPSVIGNLPIPRRRTTPDAILDPNVVVLDVRPSDEYLNSHLRGSLHAPLEQGFTMWIGWFVPYDQDIVLVAKNQTDADDASRSLAMIGADRVVAWVGSEVLCDIEDQSLLAQTTSLPADQIGEFKGTILDVRGHSEYDEEFIPGATHVPLGYLPRHRDDLPLDQTLYVHCHAGSRSPIATAVLERMGAKRIVDVSDGFVGLEKLKLVERAMN